MSPSVATTSLDIITVSGPEAVTYLQGQLSQDLAAMVEGDTAWTFVLAPQGKVEGWGRVHRLDEERVSIAVDAGAGEAWDARLRRFLLRTKAEIEVAPSIPVVAVRGEGAEAVIGQLIGAAGAGWRDAGWPGTEGFDRVSGADHREVVEGLEEAGATLIDEEAFAARRIRAGVPQWGSEIDADTIPATLGQWTIDSSVSFTKGCYTGQELVARIDSRGNTVPRPVRLLRVDDPEPAGWAPGVDSPVVHEGREVGRTTSAVPSLGEGLPALALAIIARSVPVGATVELEGSDGPVTAVVHDQPSR